MTQLDDESQNAELLTLHRIDETCTRLQTQGKYLEALECMERGLVLRQHFFGASSDEVWKACKTVGEMCNLLAMTYLQQEDFAMVLELLKKAEILSERDNYGRAVTYNNLACYYRRLGKLHASLTYLQKAAKMERQLDNVTNRADTHLNLCAVLSQLGRHGPALEHAQSSLILLQEELFPNPLDKKERQEPGADRIAVLAIAYHNIGVEQEFLKRSDMAMESYRKGVEISKAHLGESHGITHTLNNSYIAAKKSLASRKPPNTKVVARIGAKSKKMGARSEIDVKRQDSKWKNIEKAYGEVVNGVKPKPVISNIILDSEDFSEFTGKNEDKGPASIIQDPIENLITPRNSSALEVINDTLEIEEPVEDEITRDEQEMDDQKDDSFEQKQDMDDQKDDSFEQKQEMDDPEDDSFEQKQETDGQKDGSFEQKQETDDQKDDSFEQKQEMDVEKDDSFAPKEACDSNEEKIADKDDTKEEKQIDVKDTEEEQHETAKEAGEEKTEEPDESKEEEISS